MYVLTAAHCKQGLRLDGKDVVLIGAKSKTNNGKMFKLTKTYFVQAGGRPGGTSRTGWGIRGLQMSL